MTQSLRDLKNADSVSKKGEEAGAKTTGGKTRSSVGAVLSQKETLNMLKLEAKGPPNEVKQRFGVTRLSAFVLTPANTESETWSKGAVSLNIGENVIEHDPYQSGREACYLTVHAYLKRILLTTNVANCVVLISKSAADEKVEAPPRGFQAV